MSPTYNRTNSTQEIFVYYVSKIQGTVNQNTIEREVENWSKCIPGSSSAAICTKRFPMPIDIWQDMIFLVKVVPILLPIHIIRILRPHILLVRLILAWPRCSLVLSSLLEVLLHDQIGNCGGANLFPSCCDAFEEFRD